MTCYVVTNQSGQPVSYTTVLPASLPAALTANPISNADYQSILAGLKTWLNGAVADTGLATQQANLQTIAAALAQALTDLQAILDSADPAAGTLTAAQLSTAVRQIATAVKTMALVQKRGIRYLTGDFTASA